MKLYMIIYFGTNVLGFTPAHHGMADCLRHASEFHMNAVDAMKVEMDQQKAAQLNAMSYACEYRVSPPKLMGRK